MQASSATAARRRRILDEMGIAVWARRGRLEAPPLETPRPETPDWQRLREAVGHCTACTLHRTRTQTVFGVGSPTARWMVIGEAPGAEEDRQGEPFVGAAGKLLNEMLRAVGVERGAVFIANILKCRPPNNRDPLPEEVSACAGHLQAQIELVAPALILAVGRIAAQNLLQEPVPLGRLRGRVHAWGARAIPLVVTYHPAYLLRSPADKRKAWDDLRMARELVDPRQP
ncbi:MAG: uracil-DNA glycosylase [Gammaproteobacteria bacterium]|nr:uracil-DNA glycosylase [Gammaproteobacteria bacterium]